MSDTFKAKDKVVQDFNDKLSSLNLDFHKKLELIPESFFDLYTIFVGCTLEISLQKSVDYINEVYKHLHIAKSRSGISYKLIDYTFGFSTLYVAYRFGDIIVTYPVHKEIENAIHIISSGKCSLKNIDPNSLESKKIVCNLWEM